MPDIILPKLKAVKKIDDDFYPAWDRFLAKAPNRTSSISTLAKRVAQTEKAAHNDENGLKVKEESSVKSYDQAKAECKAKVRAIVTECRRLNQKYVDRHFDLENEEDDCIYPLGNSSYDDENARPSAVKRIEVGYCMRNVVPVTHVESRTFSRSQSSMKIVLALPMSFRAVSVIAGYWLLS